MAKTPARKTAKLPRGSIKTMKALVRGERVEVSDALLRETNPAKFSKSMHKRINALCAELGETCDEIAASCSKGLGLLDEGQSQEWSGVRSKLVRSFREAKQALALANECVK